MIDIDALNEKFDDEFLRFERIPAEQKLSQRPDLCAFILLDKLLPGTRDIICSAEHDEFWLDIDKEKLAEVATEEDILTLVRCGVRLDSEIDLLAMFA